MNYVDNYVPETDGVKSQAHFSTFTAQSWLNCQAFDQWQGARGIHVTPYLRQNGFVPKIHDC